MFLNVCISGQPVRALVDSGATRSFIGSENLKMLGRLGVRPVAGRGLVQVTNSRVELVSQEITAPLRLKGRTKELCMRVLPTLPVDVALGLDFLKDFGILVDYEDRRWSFKDNPAELYHFDFEKWTSDRCCGITELTSGQARTLQDFLNQELPQDTGKPGLTTLAEHVIDVGGHEPIKRRHYLVSPRVMEAISAEVDAMLADDIIELSNSG